MSQASRELIIVDASACAAWVLPDEDSEASLKLYEQALVADGFLEAPSIWVWETGNLLLSAVKSKRLQEVDLEECLLVFANAKLMLDPPPDLMARTEIIRLASKHRLSYNDASYLELAIRRRGMLASFDKDLVKAAKSNGVICLDL